MDLRGAGTHLSCVLLGSDSLLMECGDVLMRSGHEVVAVVAGSRKVASWAAGKGIGVIDGSQGADWIGKVRSLAFDWLFAITHLEIIPTEALALPRKGAINFHDGPLPRYAGLNAPVWALIEGAETYGVTWHLITESVDEGDVVASRVFDVDPADTSLSINTRNFALAIESFEGLVRDLASGELKGVPQERDAKRAVYRRADRPDALCLIDWRRPAAELERLVRALDFGPYPNPIGRAAVRHGGAALSVTRAELREGAQGEPGKALAVTPGEVVVACGSGALVLKAFSTPAGQALDPAQAAERLRLTEGGILDGVERHADALTRLGTRLARNEAAQLRRLADLTPVELPWVRTAGAEHRPRFASLDVSVPPQWAATFGEQAEAALVAGFNVLLSRLSGKEVFHLAAVDSTVADGVALAGALVSPWSPLEARVDGRGNFRLQVDKAAAELDRLARAGSFVADLIARDPELGRRADHSSRLLVPIGLRIDAPGEPEPGLVAELVVTSGRCALRLDEALIDRDGASLFLRCLEQALAGLCADPAAPVGRVDILGADLRRQVLEDWNAPDTPVPALCVHQAFERQVDLSPDAVAGIFEDASITYGELDTRANRLATYLRSLAIGPDRLVGIHVERGLDLLVSVLAVLKAGGAYVPLDPAYPADRLRHMIEDSGCRVILSSNAVVDALPPVEAGAVQVVRVDGDHREIERFPAARRDGGALPENLCYCIYTSGSTGLPKGVLLEHRNVVNFFAGMDERVPHAMPATWFAVTSLSFDISVLELLYTLARGFTVVIYRDRDRDEAASASVGGLIPAAGGDRPIDFSLFYFSGDEAENTGSGKYRLLLDGARWADKNDFRAVWTPERHFHAFGGLYPQPAVTGAAVAAVTERVAIRAGSVVMPLHHPVRVAEAWSIVDNLSNGRAGISIASGWQPDDFVLMPENFARAKDIMFRNAELVQRLWRGEKVAFPGPLGKDVEVRTLPRPVQPQLPLWVTSAGNPETFAQAGHFGANVLTHLLGQSVEQLAPKLAAYRQARAEAGHGPDTGSVTLMLHSFVTDDEAKAREIVREPLKAYLGTSLSLLKQYAWAFPAFQKPKGGEAAGGDELANLTEEERDAVLEFAYLRYYETSGLFGTPASASAMVSALKGIGVDEIACLIDFGVDTETVLANLPHLGELHRRSQPREADAAGRAEPRPSQDQSVAAQLRRHGVTHFQCTPSMARLFTLQEDTRAALAAVPNLFVGGEAFPVALARELAARSPDGRVTNMYGPTETTVWSTTSPLGGDLDTTPIGTPIANTSVYVLDAQKQPLPPGVPGELWIGGAGVARGYHERPGLTAERFVPDPFRSGAGRMYRTGDLARWKRMEDGSGVLEFLGRIDHQVKIRGYRIELGEIEARLGQHPAVRECVVVVRPDGAGEPQLVAFLSARAGESVESGAIKDHLREALPEPMVPAHVVALPSLPHTPNGKIDRNALPALADLQERRPESKVPVAAENETERTVLAAWHATLGDEGIDVNDNFFDVGGHSLLVVRLQRRLREELEQPVALTDLYRFPTVRSFVESLSAGASDAAAQRGVDRAARRLQRRRTFA